MRLLIASLFAAVAFGQQITATATAAKAGAPTTITLIGTGMAAAGVVPAQFSMPAAAGQVITAGPTVTAANKQITCQSGGGSVLTCVFYGINTTTLADGILATITMPMPAATAPMPLTGINGSNAAGDSPAIAITSGALLTLTPLLPCDANGDGSVVDQIEGVVKPPFTDLNGDGVVDIIDLQRVINAALPGAGGTCRTGA